MSDVHLGKLAPDGADRDATHVAVVPMVAAADMKPGTRCGIDSNDRANPTVTAIGIVDPFLSESVKQGQRFYLCLFPRTVTGLRHVYVHPVLDSDVGASKAWIAAWAESEGIEYDELIEHAKTWVDTHDGKWSGRYWNEGPRFEGQVLPETFWEHYDRVTNTRTPEVMRSNFFACAC